MEPINYETPVDETNYTMRKQNYDRRKKELEYKQKRIKKEEKKFRKENKKENEKRASQIKRLQKKIQNKKTGLFRKLVIVTMILIINILIICWNLLSYSKAFMKYNNILAQSQIDEEYNEKLETYNQLVAQKAEEERKLVEQKAEEERKTEINLLEKEIFGEETDITVATNGNQNEYIEALSRYPENAIKRCAATGGSNYYIYTRKIDLDKYYITDSGTDVIYPGAIIKGNSLFSNNAYTLITEKRAPIYLTSNHEDGYSVEVKNPNYGTVSDALRTFQTQISSQNAKEWTYEAKIVTSSEELNATLGIQAGSSSTNIGANLGWSSSEESTTIAVIFTQTYYTISVAPNVKATDFFEGDIHLEKLGKYEPAYVSSVDYGRMITMFVTADMTQKELSAKVNGCFKGVGISAGLEKLEKTEGLELSYFFYGGNTSNISTAIDEKEGSKGIIGDIKTFFVGESKENVVNRINSYIDANSELVNPVPLSYELKYLSDNAFVPKMSISRQEIFCDQNIKMVHLKLSKDTDKSFIINFPEGTLKVDQANFLWNTDMPINLNGSFDGKAFEIPLDGSMSGDYSFPLKQMSNVELNISITDVDER